MNPALDTAVASVPLKRVSLDAAPIPKQGFLISGRPHRWGKARRAIEKRGGMARGYYDAFGLYPECEYDGMTVHRPDNFPFVEDVEVLFAGKPRKEWFNHALPGLQRCTWLDAIDERRRRGWYEPQLLAERRDALERVYDLLADSVSKRIFASLIRARVEGNTGYIEISEHREYLHPIAAPAVGDVVIDAGAYDGDTARLFAKCVGVEGRVIALEPSFENYLKLAQFSHHVKEQNVIPLCLAAWDKPTCLSFDCDKQSGGSNRVGDSGGGSVAATSIDMLARDLSLSRIDLVKLDVEGAEVRAIEGAREVIERYRPKLHVSIYHTKSDLVDLPLMLDELLRGYCFYMGHHSYYHTETDLYAVPLAGS